MQGKEYITIAQTVVSISFFGSINSSHFVATDNPNWSSIFHIPWKSQVACRSKLSFIRKSFSPSTDSFLTFSQFQYQNFLKTFLVRMLQNRAVRMITNSAFDTPAKPLLANLGLRSISELNKNELKLITYNSLNGLAPNYLRQLLIRNSQQSCRALRNTDRDLKLPLKRTNNGQRGYSFRGAKSWNGLSAGAKCAPSLASFKSYL